MFFSIGIKSIKSARQILFVSGQANTFWRSEHIHTGTVRMTLMDTSAYNLSPNCRKILTNAEQLAMENKSPFVGTEHVLKSLLTVENWILPWLINKPVGLDRDQTEKEVNEMIRIAQSEESPNFYYPCLERSLEIAGAIWSGQQLPTEGLVLGALLAHKDVKNAMGSILNNAAVDRNILEPLLDNLSLAKNRLELIPPISSESFAFSQNPMTILQSEECVNNKANKPALSTLMPDVQEMEKPAVSGTHWVIPGLLMCGRSPGGMTSQEVTDLVEAGVDTFVSLQESYTERDCKDYRLVLQSLANKSFPPNEISFLECPMKKVLPDRDFIAFISELKRSLEGGHTLYIHCYGGHGRTGAAVVNLLEVVYGIDMTMAMKMLSETHSMRGCADCALNKGKFEGVEQTKQTERLEPIMYKRSKKINM